MPILDGVRVPLGRMLWLIICVGSVGVADEPDADYVVSPEGSDDDDGTYQAPFATIERAQRALRKQLTAGVDRDLRVLLRGGTYRLTAPLRFSPSDAGEGHAVIYTAAADETVVISGGLRLAGWHAEADGTLRTTLSETTGKPWSFRELFVNGHRRTRARIPNEGYFRIARTGPDHRTSFGFEPEDIVSVKGLSGAELVFLHDWSISRVGIQFVDDVTHNLRVTHAIGARPPHFEIDHFEPHPRYFLENARELLDGPGEWYLDEDRGELFYLPVAGESPATMEAEAPIADALLIVRGTNDRPVRNLRFRGLTFRHGGWQLPAEGYAGIQATYHERRDGTPERELQVPVPAAILCDRAERCQFDHCRVEHVGGSGIWLGRACRDCEVTDCVVRDVAGNGILIGEDYGRSLPGGSWWQVAPQQAARGNRVTNCLVERCGAEFFGAVGIWVGYANDTTIAHNLVRHLPYTGVSLGWMWNATPTPCHHNLVEGNHIHDVMQVLSDGGGIYTLGLQPGTVLRGNLIHGVPANTGNAESNGIFLDEGTTGVEIAGNLIYDVTRSPLRFHQAGRNVVRGNRLVVEPGVPPLKYNATPVDNIELDANTVAAASTFDSSRIPQLLPDAGRIIKDR